jgi:hypothetical protein
MRERQVLGNGLKLDARPAPCWPSDDRYLDLAYPTTRRKRSILLDFEQQGLQLVPLQFGVPLGFKHSGPVGSRQRDRTLSCPDLLRATSSTFSSNDR